MNTVVYASNKNCYKLQFISWVWKYPILADPTARDRINSSERNIFILFSWELKAFFKT